MGPLSYLEVFCVPERAGKILVNGDHKEAKVRRQNLSDLISSLLKSTLPTTVTTIMSQNNMDKKFGGIDKRCCET